MKPRPLYLQKLKKWIDTPVIKVITGVRRAGKSYLLLLLSQELQSRGIEQDHILYINFELIENDSLRDYKRLNEWITACYSKCTSRLYILIDEIQNCQNWERAVSSFLVDFDCDIFLTGSNANLLSGELATHIAGRYVEMEVYPLTFSEYLFFNNLNINDDNSMELFFYDYLKYGGFPGLHLLPQDDELKRQYLKGILDSVVLKDVIQRNVIRDAELLERILIYIMDNVGQLFSAQKIADYLKSLGKHASIDSVYSYIAALENALIIHAARRYDIKGKKLLKRMEKYFICDLGLRYAAIGYRTNDISQILENIVYMNLRATGYTVLVGKEGEREIDFIAEKDNQKVYIQVAYLLVTDTVVEREYLPLVRVKDHYPKWVLSMDKISIGERDGIGWKNLIDFLISGL